MHSVEVTVPRFLETIDYVSESWTDDVLAVLRRDGAVVISTNEVEDVEEWRRAVRRACRAAGLRIRTGVTTNGRAWVEHVDHVVTEAEMRAVARAVDNAMADGPTRPFHELVRDEQRKRFTVVTDVSDLPDCGGEGQGIDRGQPRR